VGPILQFCHTRPAMHRVWYGRFMQCSSTVKVSSISKVRASRVRDMDRLLFPFLVPESPAFEDLLKYDTSANGIGGPFIREYKYASIFCNDSNHSARPKDTVISFGHV